MKETHTPPRSVRVSDPVWEAAKAEADRRGETVTDAVVRFLTRYGKPSYQWPLVRGDETRPIPPG
jgi:hypothetical protein